MPKYIIEKSHSLGFSSDSDIMLCPTCKHCLDDDWIVCPWCGTKIEKDEEKKHNWRKSRGNGSGTAFKRKNTWTAKITVGFKIEEKDGEKVLRPISKTKGGFRTKKAALEYCRDLREQLDQSKTKVTAPTLEDYYKAFCNGHGDSLSKSKRDAYQFAYNKMEVLHKRPIDTILISDLQAVVREKCPTYYPARDMKNLLSFIYKLAAADGYVNVTLPSLIELPKLEENERTPFTEEEQKLLWASYEQGNKDAAIPLIMIYTGMMTGEMQKLQTSMIHLKEKEIVGVGIKTKERKEKSVLIPEAIIPVLEDVMDGIEGKIFRMNEENFYKRYYASLEAAGITRKLTPYSCRHTTATRLAIDKSVAPQIVQRILRWSSTKMMDRYVHADDSVALEALNKLDGSVKPE